MESEIVVRKNMTLTNEKVKNMCRLNYEDNDFLFTTHDGKCVIIDKSKQDKRMKFFKKSVETLKYKDSTLLSYLNSI